MSDISAGLRVLADTFEDGPTTALLRRAADELDRVNHDRDGLATGLYDAKVEEGRLRAQIRTLQAALGRMEREQESLNIPEQPCPHMAWVQFNGRCTGCGAITSKDAL